MAVSSFLPRLVFVAACLALAACGGKDDDKPYAEAPVETLYNNALNELSAGDYVPSAKSFEEVERQHPYSVWATKAQLMAAFAYYQANKYEDALVALDRFIQLHPGNRDIAYAFYLRALCYYEQISDVARDQRMTELALQALREVTTRFPETRYARDATLKIDLTNDHLAGKEMAVGRYYLNRGDYIGAINRFRTVVDVYQTTPQIAEALERLTEAYYSLGLNSEAQTAAAVLGKNYPGSPWYQAAYNILRGRNLKPMEDRGSWISQAFRKIL
jgi:outer membrane protein assembly factor BamD